MEIKWNVPCEVVTTYRHSNSWEVEVKEKLKTCRSGVNGRSGNFHIPKKVINS